MYWPEKYQLGFLREYLHDHGIAFVTEPYLFSIPIDILGARDDETFAVELKTKDFGRGINQAERNCSFVDFSYLSVWDERATEDLVARVEETPIGLLAVGDRVECLSRAGQNDPSEHARSRAMELVVDNVREHPPVQS
jgi:hypothetical protein